MDIIGLSQVHNGTGVLEIDPYSPSGVLLVAGSDTDGALMQYGFNSAQPSSCKSWDSSLNKNNVPEQR